MVRRPALTAEEQQWLHRRFAVDHNYRATTRDFNWRFNRTVANSTVWKYCHIPQQVVAPIQAKAKEGGLPNLQGAYEHEAKLGFGKLGGDFFDYNKS